MQVPAQAPSSSKLLATPRPQVRLDLEKWHLFLKAQGLNRVGVCDFYGSFPDIADAHGSRQAIETLSELIWYDLVSSGAITLPAGLSTSSFSFSVLARQYGPFVGIGFESLVVRNESSGREEIVMINPVHIFNTSRKRKMNSRYMEGFAQKLRDATQKTL